MSLIDKKNGKCQNLISIIVFLLLVSKSDHYIVFRKLLITVN